jgi:hypothetical protein
MAFVKLLPPDGRHALPVRRVVQLLRDEFALVETDPEQGRDHVSQMITTALRLPDILPAKQEMLTRLPALQNDAVYVTFGDGPDAVAGCCVMPDTELFFGRPDEVDGPARPLVDRAAAALGYEVLVG